MVVVVELNEEDEEKGLVVLLLLLLKLPDLVLRVFKGGFLLVVLMKVLLVSSLLVLTPALFDDGIKRCNVCKSNTFLVSAVNLVLGVILILFNGVKCGSTSSFRREEEGPLEERL